MKRKWLLSFVVTVFAVTAWCADINIAVVDMLRVMNFHPDMNSDRLMLEKQIEEFDSEQKEMMIVIDKLKKELNEISAQSRDNTVAEGVRVKKMKLAEEKLADLKEREQKRQQTADIRQNQISDQSRRMRQKLESRIRVLVQKYAKEKNFNLVLDSSGIGGNGLKTVVYSEEKIDITAEILGIIDSSRRKNDE